MASVLTVLRGQSEGSHDFPARVKEGVPQLSHGLAQVRGVLYRGILKAISSQTSQMD